MAMFFTPLRTEWKEKGHTQNTKYDNADHVGILKKI